mmetsp:Transcript_61155/g.133934  ORF Transcript_61155/g.133934 Transcript_61155/m.133934 type:complete len:179 (+) Transcript_61155:88-624(+)|eukprot:CAMPEP_0206503982 /NCGR_PEP_ID=MMETSP0324_2-20121206/55138_1 /ASSEMBLY_ACC=CAM_ASM_000836 /TAXON_ID=2866 /ORGANISM="Crypthecodinium cohnii, Strain Seligo" /LENGTH=178 /DNA_ID=CAMNT_0053992913 /DNA_START=73 /DNA_END=609 /DNA_ORIENTATION=-
MATVTESRMVHHNDYFLGRPTSRRPEVSSIAKGAIPGYAGHKPTYCKDKSSPAASVCGDTVSEVSSTVSGVPMSQRAVRAPPGYAGYIPGKQANTVVGRSFKPCNREAVASCKATPTEEVPLQKHEYHNRVRIPGYSGFMPGKASDNLYGTSPVKAAKENWLVETRKKEKGGGLVDCD